MDQVLELESGIERDNLRTEFTVHRAKEHGVIA